MFSFEYPSPSRQKELELVAAALGADGKFILEDDGEGEEDVQVENDKETKKIFADSSKTFSGILFRDTTVNEKCTDGTLCIDLLKNKNVTSLAGIKVENEVAPVLGTFEEKLVKRCREYKKKGCKFAKWSSFFTTPYSLLPYENATILAHYASICQNNGIVPILETEILQDGDHTIEQCQQVTAKLLHKVYKALFDYNVHLEGTLLKPSWVSSGSSSKKKDTPAQIAHATITTLLRTVPAAVPGIVFLASEEHMTTFKEIQNHPGKKPWNLSLVISTNENPVTVNKMVRK